MDVRLFLILQLNDLNIKASSFSFELLHLLEVHFRLIAYLLNILSESLIFSSKRSVVIKNILLFKFKSPELLSTLTLLIAYFIIMSSKLLWSSCALREFSIYKLILSSKRLNVFSKLLNLLSPELNYLRLFIEFFSQVSIFFLDLSDFLLSFLDSLHVLVFLSSYDWEIVLNWAKLTSLSLIKLLLSIQLFCLHIKVSLERVNLSI